MKNLSIRARVAFAILCLEYLLDYFKYDSYKWAVIIDKLWEYTNSNVGKWHEHLSEMTPFSIEEEIEFEKKGCDYISKSKHDELKELYKNVHPDVLRIINLIFEIGTRDLYSSITNSSPDTLLYTNEIIEILKKHKVEIPSTEKLAKYPIDQNEGWGNEFIKKDIS